MSSSPPDFAGVIRRHQLGLWRYLRMLGAPADLAEDVMQDTFLVAMKKLRDERADAATAAFLRQTARHLFLRRRRDQGRREELLTEIADRWWQEQADSDDGERWLAALRACVGTLDGRARDVVDRFYGDGLARDAVAAALGMKETGVKTLLQRVRAALRECIERRLRGDA
jgi:RNA polymerase sigma-70 factor (ECF subfamily)